MSSPGDRRDPCHHSRKRASSRARGFGVCGSVARHAFSSSVGTDRHALTSVTAAISFSRSTSRSSSGDLVRIEHGFAASIEQPYGFDTIASGMRIDRRMRRLYREALLAAERSEGEEPPNPFLDPDAFVAWMLAMYTS